MAGHPWPPPCGAPLTQRPKLLPAILCSSLTSVYPSDVLSVRTSVYPPDVLTVRSSVCHRSVQCAPEGTSPDPSAVGQGAVNGLMGSASRLSIHSNKTSRIAVAVLTLVLVGITMPFAASVPALSSMFLSRMPITEPANAAANHTHQCRLPDEMPLKYAPTLHPKAMRAL